MARYRRKKRSFAQIALDFFRVILLFGAVALAAVALERYAQEELVGTAKVIDGDSLSLNGVEMRLKGIDAPEYVQTCKDGNGQTYSCGRVARDHLSKLIGGNPVTCEGLDKDKYDRLLVVCRAGKNGNTTELNATMVADGWAVSFGGYEGLESQASAQKRGLWAGSFERPRDFRDMRYADLPQVELPVVKSLVSGAKRLIGLWGHGE